MTEQAIKTGRSGSPSSVLRPLSSGFTLLELLAVITIIAILAGIVIGVGRRASEAGKTARAKAELAALSAALETYKRTYGDYPVLHSSNLVNPPGQATDPATLHLFHDVLAAKRRDGSVLPAYSTSTNNQFPEAQNRKLISFFSFGDSDFTNAISPTPYLIHDAFDNTEIAVLWTVISTVSSNSAAISRLAASRWHDTQRH